MTKSDGSGNTTGAGTWCSGRRSSASSGACVVSNSVSFRSLFLPPPRLKQQHNFFSVLVFRTLSRVGEWADLRAEVECWEDRAIVRSKVLAADHREGSLVGDIVFVYLNTILQWACVLLRAWSQVRSHSAPPGV
jgi:hypothetical protein